MTTTHDKILLDTMVQVVRTNLKQWVNVNGGGQGYLYDAILAVGVTQSARIACKVVLETILSEMPVTKVAAEIGERMQIAIVARASGNAGTYYKRLSILVQSIGQRKARKSKLSHEKKWPRKQTLGVGLVLLTKVKEWTGMVQYVKNPEEPNYTRRNHLVAATPDCLAWLKNSRASIDATRSQWQPSPKKFPRFEGDGEIADAVNRAQDIGWRLNTRVIDVIEYCFSLGIRAPGIPGGPKPPEADKAKLTKYEWGKLQKAKFAWTSGRRRTSLFLTQARGLPDTEFFYRWKHDFRGRLNCAGRFVSPQGNDMGKAMLQFHRGMPLGENGSWYLSQHGANCWGLSHASASARWEWVTSSRNAIIEVAKDPIGSLSWWSQAEDPWRFLAFCFEWSDCLDLGEKFVTHLPCQIDGTCNGFQIVAMLMRDPDLARKTNLIHQDCPNDLYSLVAMDVEDELRKDDPFGWLYQLDGAVHRSVVKGPTLSTGFGANMWSANEATKKWFWQQPWDFPFGGKVNGPCFALTKLVRAALAKHCRSHSVLSNWFSELVREIDGPVSWRSPTGLDITTTSFKQRRVKANTLHYWEETEVLDKARINRAVLPNFIQSLDAAALARTLSRCDYEVSPIHDCFGAHAPNMKDLHRVVRWAYADLFSTDLLADLVDQLGIDKAPPPGMGVFEPNDIRYSRYSFT